jgi:hypothetical protein
MSHSVAFRRIDGRVRGVGLVGLIGELDEGNAVFWLETGIVGFVW